MYQYIGLDFETYSACDITEHGADRYVSDPTFRVLMACSAEFDQAQGVYQHDEFDFVLDDFEDCKQRLADAIVDRWIIAHNASFEYKVLESLGLEHLPAGYIDSAMLSRVNGGSGSLAMASRQFLGKHHKLEEGKDLIKLFCIPGPYQESGNLEFDPRIVNDHRAMWTVFLNYCRIDAELGFRLWRLVEISTTEEEYADITWRMNLEGWTVDKEMVQEMYLRYLENQSQALSDFMVKHQQADLNVNSLKQLKEFCSKRGIKSSSFDEKNVARLKRAIERKQAAGGLTLEQATNYDEVMDLLNLKQTLGGSSLKKLKVILDTIVEVSPGHWKLRDQYLHCGAGQTRRTSGRSVQMQNLKQMGTEVGDMSELLDPDAVWNNEELAENIRQVFTAEHPQGQLIVGDLASIESRGLAFQAGEDWKLEAYRKKLDLYKVLATKIYHIHYDDVLKPQRQVGKVGELSCGYGAGPDAVKGFAEKMGVDFTEAECLDLVTNWRGTNPMVVDYWQRLDDALHALLSTGYRKIITLPEGMALAFKQVDSPDSLVEVFPQARTLMITLVLPNGEVPLTRTFHGAYESGRNVRYYKPSKKKTGDSWVNNYKDPKTHQLRFYELYGGKLAGILTQSLCREIFFERLQAIQRWVDRVPNLKIVGQFHDEVVLDWQPQSNHLGSTATQLWVTDAMQELEKLMSTSPMFPTLPMAAEVKSDYRYTK